jgi:hypothetical protein
MTIRGSMRARNDANADRADDANLAGFAPCGAEISPPDHQGFAVVAGDVPRTDAIFDRTDSDPRDPFNPYHPRSRRSTSTQRQARIADAS